MKKVYYLSTFVALFMGAASFAEDEDANRALVNPALPSVYVSASDPVAFRGLSSGAFLVRRDRTEGDLTVSIALGGSAENGVDYATLPASVTIPAGFYTVGLPVNPLGGSASAPNQWVILTVQDNAAYQIGNAKASVQIKGNYYEDRAPEVSITSPESDTGIPAHSNLPITAKATDANDSIVKVSFYANDKFLGVSTTSPYTVTWTDVPAGQFSLFARAEDQFGKSTLSAAIHLTVTNPPPANATVALTSPAAGASFGPGGDIKLEAAVTGPGPVQAVSFYSGDKLLGTATTPPYAFVWSKVGPGRYNLRAKVTETSGAVGASEPVRITVSNALPKVAITSPADKAVVEGPADLPITATASDADGGVAKVNFYGDGLLLGSVDKEPYTLIWPKVSPGKHIIVATATDIYGAFSSSAATITVSNPPPTVTLTAPANNTTLTAPATLELKADASDADGVQYVSFWSGDRRLSSDTTAPYSYTLNDLPPGTYTFRAHAVDKFGLRTASEPVTVTVKRP